MKKKVLIKDEDSLEIVKKVFNKALNSSENGEIILEKDLKEIFPVNDFEVTNSEVAHILTKILLKDQWHNKIRLYFDSNDGELKFCVVKSLKSKEKTKNDK